MDMDHTRISQLDLATTLHGRTHARREPRKDVLHRAHALAKAAVRTRCEVAPDVGLAVISRRSIKVRSGQVRYAKLRGS